MECRADDLKSVPLFAPLNEEELKVLAAQVELKTFATRQRIYKIGDLDGQAYIMLSGNVEITIVDEDQQEVVFDAPGRGDFFGFASMLEMTPHQTNAFAVEETTCVEVSREDIQVLLERKPMAGMHMLSVLGRQIHASQHLVRVRASRNANDIFEEKASFGERLADLVARFGGSWTFILTLGTVLLTYAAVNVELEGRAWDPYPFILLNLLLAMLGVIQAPVIMMSQNRQDAKDRLRGELEYDVNRRAEAEIQALSRKLNVLTDKLGDIDDLLRERMHPVRDSGARG